MYSQDPYIELLKQFPPRPIKSEEEFQAMQEIVNQLLDKPELREEESDYLDVLGMLIYEYEKDLDIVTDIYGVELLKVLLDERNLKQKDLVSIFKTESIVSDVLNEKRKLTTRHIKKFS